MLFEKPVSLATTGISLVIFVSEFYALLKEPNQVPRSIVIVGPLVGALGIYLGSAVAGSYNKTLGRTLRLTAWGLIGIAMSIGTVYFGLRAPEWWNKLLFFGAACLPLFAHVAVLFQGWRKDFFKGHQRE